MFRNTSVVDPGHVSRNGAFAQTVSYRQRNRRRLAAAGVRRNCNVSITPINYAPLIGNSDAVAANLSPTLDFQLVIARPVLWRESVTLSSIVVVRRIECVSVTVYD